MVYSSDALILVEVDLPTWCGENFNDVLNKKGVDSDSNLIDEVRAMAQVKEVSIKQRVARRFD